MGPARHEGEGDPRRGGDEVRSATTPDFGLGLSPCSGDSLLLLAERLIGPVSDGMLLKDTGPTHTMREPARVEMLSAEGVSALAVGLASMLGSGPFSPEYVDSHGNGFQVIGADASSYSAKMVDREPIWNGTDVDLVTGAMGENLLALYDDSPVAWDMLTPVWQPDPSVAFGGEAPGPQPVLATLVSPSVDLLA